MGNLSPQMIQDMGIGFAEGFIIGILVLVTSWVVFKIMKTVLIVSAVTAIIYFVTADNLYIKGLLEGANIDSLVNQFKEAMNSASAYVGAGFISASKATSEMSMERLYSAMAGLVLGAAVLLLGNKKKKGK